MALLCAIAWFGPATSAENNPPATGPIAGHSFHGDAFNEGPRQKAYLMQGTGRIRFPVTTSSREAQAFFEQGIGQLHGFWYFEAERSFRQAATLDPDLAMAYWGMALANINNDERAKKFIEEAAKRKEQASAREKAWIAAWENHYAAGERKKEEQLSELIKALEKIVFDYPDDLEAKAFLAMTIVWRSPSITSRQAVESLIAQVLAREPMHPVHHFRIHLWDYEAPERALQSAALCGQTAPAIAHMWHMPGHIFSALHRYADAAWQQEASARVDHAQMMRDRLMPEQIHNYTHNNGWLVENLDYTGRVHDAVDLAKNMVELPRLIGHAKPDSTENSYASEWSSYARGRSHLMGLLLRYEQWDELLRLAATRLLVPGSTTREKVEYYRATGIAHHARGDEQSAKQAVASLESLLKEEARTVAESKPEKETSKPGTPEEQPDQRLQPIETAIAELKAHIALREGPSASELALDVLAKTANFPKAWLARLQYQAGKTAVAEETAREAVKDGPGQTHPLATYIDILRRNGKTELAREQFGELRKISAAIDLDIPAFKRLEPMAQDLGPGADWRLKPAPGKDIGRRPKLSELGPFRWSPSPAPAWSLPGLDGHRLSLADYRGRPILVIFYLGKGCVHCMQQLNAFAPVAGRFKEAGVELVAVSTDSVEGLAGTFEKSAAKEGFPFPFVSDHSLEVFKAYRAYDDFENTALHGTFLIDGTGRVRWQDISYEPFMETELLLEETQRLLRMQQPN